MAYKGPPPISIKDGGTGTISFTDLCVLTGAGTSSLESSSMVITAEGQMTNPSQSAFLAYLPSPVLNATGNGAT